MVPSQRYCTRCGAANQAQDAFCFACGHPLQATPASPQYPLAGSASNTSTGLLTPNLLLKQRYRILEPLGKGGFGAVYKTEDVQLGNRLLAVKEMSQSSLSPQEIAEAAENFKREALLLAALKHPNLPSIYDHFNEAGRWYLVMDFIEGETLEEHLTKKPEGHLSVEEALQIGMQLCTVLSYLHNRQPPIIFRDLKPANIMLTPEGHLYLIDFGIARYFKPGQTRDTIAFGSPGYAAPEQYGKAQTTARSDIYSLGATLYRLLTGVDPSQTPFQFAPLHPHDQSTPPGLEPLLMHMLEMNESNRPASMTEVKQELQRIITQQSVGQVTMPPPVAQPATPGGISLQSAQTTTPGTHPQVASVKTSAYSYLKAKRYQEALVAFEQAIQLDHTNALFYNGKGLALDNLKRYQEALLAYDRAIQLDPKNSMTYINKGTTLNNLGRYEEGLVAHNKTIELDPKNSYAYNNKAVALSALGRHTEALVACEQAIQLDPKNSAIINCKGKVLSGLGRKEEALAAYNEAIKLDPQYSLAYFNKGTLLAELRRYKEALAAYDEAIKVDPRNSEVYANKGSLLCALGNYKVAQVCFQRAMAFNPSEQVVRFVQQVKKLYKLS